MAENIDINIDNATEVDRRNECVSSIEGITFAFSGKFTEYYDGWRSKEEIEDYLRHYGACISSGVTNKVNYLVLLDDKHTVSEKKAKQKGIQVLSSYDFDILVGKRFPHEKHIIVPSWMDHISSNAFKENTDIETVDLPQSIKSIDHGAFFYCKNLKEIRVPDNCTEVEGFAFCGCSNLEKVSLPKGLKKIGTKAFSGCEKLHSITIPRETEIGERAFASCKLLEDSNGFVVVNDILVDGLSYPSDYVVIPDGIKHIGKSAFEIQSYSRKAYNSITEVRLPSSLISIEERGFAKCKMLTCFILPEGLERIEKEAFSSCIGLRTIWIPGSVKIIHPSAFARGSQLKIYAPSGSYAESFAKQLRFRFSPCDYNVFLEKCAIK